MPEHKLPLPPLPKRRNHQLIISIIGIAFLIGLAIYAIIGFVAKERPPVGLASPEEEYEMRMDSCLEYTNDFITFISGKCRAIKSTRMQAQCNGLQGKAGACNRLEEDEKKICKATLNKNAEACEQGIVCLSALGANACEGDEDCIALANKDIAYFEKQLGMCDEVANSFAATIDCEAKAVTSEELDACFNPPTIS